MSFTGAAFNQNFTVTASGGAASDTHRTVGQVRNVAYSPTNLQNPIADFNRDRLAVGNRVPVTERLGRGVGVGGPPRGNNRYSMHDDRQIAHNDYDRNARGNWRGGRGRGGPPDNHWRGGGPRGRGDNRGNFRGNNRFQRGGHPRGGAGRGGRGGLHSEDDVSMPNLDLDSRGRPIAHRVKQEQRPNAAYVQDAWYKIRIRNTRNKGIQRPWLLQLLTEEISQAFDSYNYIEEENSIMFWIQGSELADSFRAISKRVTLPDNSKLDFHVMRENDSPVTNMADDDVTNAIKNVLNTRYTLETKALDLSEFYKHDAFKALGFYVPLNRLQVMSGLSKIINDSKVEIKALSLRGNNLTQLDTVSRFLTNENLGIEILHLGENRLKGVFELDKIKKWKLKELFLDGNPIRELKPGDREPIVTAAKKRFPQLEKLDGADMPKAIGFAVDVEDKTKPLPKAVQFAFNNGEAEAIILQFLQHYFEFYDNDKQKLLAAYHESAVFTFCAVYNKAIQSRQSNLDVYFKEYKSRNLMRKQGNSTSNVKTEPLNIVAFLNSLPKTKHDPNSFTIDVGVFSATLMTFVVTGVFREVSSSSPAPSSSSAAEADGVLRTFSRSFVTIPVGAGMQIINDQLTLTNATEAQAKLAFRPVAPVPAPNPAVLAPEQTSMLVQFIQETNLTDEFALQAMVTANWVLADAATLFLQNKDKIPPTGFRR